MRPSRRLGLFLIQVVYGGVIGVMSRRVLRFAFEKLEHFVQHKAVAADDQGTGNKGQEMSVWCGCACDKSAKEWSGIYKATL